MQFRTEGVSLQSILLMCAVLTVTSTTAQQHHEPIAATYSTTPNFIDHQTKPLAPRTLTADEGLAVLGAALESRAHPDFESDCSHLVHAIYERAGFQYPYASSSTLYAGNDGFRRVLRPQPGDLVVWRGHVGIAVNPAQGSFSASAFWARRRLLQFPIWRERGHPHFLRYVTNSPATFQTATSSRERNLKTTASPDSHPPIARPLDFNAGEQAAAQPNLATTTSPGVLLMNSARPQPKEVTEALEAVFTEAGEALRETRMC